MGLIEIVLGEGEEVGRVEAEVGEAVEVLEEAEQEELDVLFVEISSKDIVGLG